VFVPEHLNINLFHTFVGLGFLDIHVEMTVDSAQNVTSVLSLSASGQVTNLPIAPGDAMSASLCLNTNPAGTANYFVANERTGQTVNFTVDTGFPPAVTIDAGVTRDLVDNNPTISPLARFGVVYFDEISAFSTGGSQSPTAGQAVTMTDSRGSTLTSPPSQRLRFQGRLRIGRPGRRRPPSAAATVCSVSGPKRIWRHGSSGHIGAGPTQGPQCHP
jgi:hypothetical protein